MENFERTRVYLIRHGQVKGYEGFPVYGHTNVELTETGELQLQQMSERLRLVDLNAIYSSDLNRTISHNPATTISERSSFSCSSPHKKLDVLSNTPE